MVAMPKGWVVAGAVAVVLVAPAGCQQIQNVSHQRDEAAFVAAVEDFRCSLSRCGPPELDQALAADVRAHPDEYVATGDKACDWLRSHRPMLGTWGLPGGPSAADMGSRYVAERFGDDGDSQIVPAPGKTPAQIRAETLYYMVAREAWQHLCWDVVSSRTSWPEDEWTGDVD
jgi:hypothetical protein